MKTNKKTKRTVMALGAVTVGILVAVGAINMISTTDITRSWRALGEENDPGAGECGVMSIYIFPHDADPGTTYASNITEGGSYTYGYLNSSGDTNGYVPYDTAFDIVVKYRFNDTVAYNTTGSTWEMDWVRGNITCTDLGIDADTGMDEVQIDTNDDYMWVHYYMNNGGAGYTITHGESVNITSLTFEGYW